MAETLDEKASQPRMVTFTDVARLVVELGYVPNMTRAGVRRISLRDPAWPIREEDLLQFGHAKVMPWAPVEAFFRDVYKGGGRGPDKQPRKHEARPGE